MSNNITNGHTNDTCNEVPAAVVNGNKGDCLSQATFKVKILLELGESVWVVGNCPELGSWNPCKAVLLTQQLEDSSLWSCDVKLQSGIPIQYRYMTTVSLKFKNVSSDVLQRWESHVEPRVVNESHWNSGTDDTFGVKDDMRAISCGLATKQNFLTFKFKQNSIRVWKNGSEKTDLKIKVSVVNLPVYETDMSSVTSACHAEDESAFSAYIETAVMKEDMWKFVPQHEEGTTLNSQNDYLLIQIQSLNFENCAFQMHFYETDGTYIGFSTVHSENFLTTHGCLNGLITDLECRISGKVNFEFFTAKPLPNREQSLAKVCEDESYRSLTIGHRGSGVSSGIRECYPPVLENTVASFQLASDKGFDFVEFDVQLSKDFVPIIYHDYSVGLIANKDNTECNAMDVLIQDLTVKQLQSLKLHDSKVASTCPNGYQLKILDSDGGQKPFPTLETVLREVRPNLGFNVEIKFPVKLIDGSHEVERFWNNANKFLDEILNVIFAHADQRKLFFSCFNPDICAMLRMKQNVYPVFFLIQGKSDRWLPCDDRRTMCIENAISSALNANLQGIVAHVDEIISDLELVKLVHNSKLLLYAWGEPSNSNETLAELRANGIDGVIHDWF